MSMKLSNVNITKLEILEINRPLIKPLTPKLNFKLLHATFTKIFINSTDFLIVCGNSGGRVVVYGAGLCEAGSAECQEGNARA